MENLDTETMTQSEKPVLYDVTYNVAQVESFGSRKLPKRITANFKIKSGYVGDVTLYAHILSGSEVSDNIEDFDPISPADYGSFNLSSSTITVDLSKKCFIKGKIYYLYLGPPSLSSTSELISIGAGLKIAQIPGIKAKPAPFTTKEDKKYIGNSVILQYTASYNDQSSTKNNYAKISDPIYIYYNIKKADGSNKTFNSTISSTNIKIVSATSALYQSNQDITEVLKELQPNEEINFYLQGTDLVGNKVVSETYTYTRAPLPAFSGANPEFVPDPFNVYDSNSSIVLTHAPASDVNSTENFEYKYYITNGSRDIQVLPSLNIETNLITANFNDVESFSNATLELIPTNSEVDTHNLKIKIEATSEFAGTGTITCDFSATTYAPPVFIENAVFSLMHDYDIGRANFNSIDSDYIKNINGSTPLDTIMFNKDEGLIFKIPEASSLMGQIISYDIYLSRNIMDSEGGIIELSNATFGSAPWLSISPSDLKRFDTNDKYYYYRHKFSQYTRNEYFYFKISAKDEKGNSTSPIYCRDYIYGCRVVPPKFSLTNSSISKNGSNIDLKFHFSVTDLGGSATTEGWNWNFYNSYPNFLREIEGYEQQNYLIIEIDSNQEFNSEDKKVYSIAISSPTYSLDYTIEPFTAIVEISKVFARFTMVSSYGINTSNEEDGNFKGLAIVSSSPQILTQFGTLPTVSHRAHHIGINTLSMSENDVLVIENYENRKFIILKGVYNNTSGIITIDLTTGIISGATIDGGEW